MRPWCMGRAREMTTLLQARRRPNRSSHVHGWRACGRAAREFLSVPPAPADARVAARRGVARSNSTLPPSALSSSAVSSIEVVVASCQNDLWWLRFPLEPAQLAAFRLAHAHDGVPQVRPPTERRPAEWELVELRNDGRNDHSFLRHIVSLRLARRERPLHQGHVELDVPRPDEHAAARPRQVAPAQLQRWLRLRAADAQCLARLVLAARRGDGAGSLRQFQLRAYATKHDQQRAGRTFGMARPAASSAGPTGRRCERRRIEFHRRGGRSGAG